MACRGAPTIPEPRRDDSLAWARTVRLAEQQRVLGLLAAAVADGALSLDDEQLDVLADAHEGWCAHDLRLERTLLRAADALDAAAIPFLVTKGPAHRPPVRTPIPRSASSPTSTSSCPAGRSDRPPIC